jgi:surface antigen
VKHIALAILFTFLIQPISSLASDLRTPLSALGGVRNDYESPDSAVTIFANLMKARDGALSKEDRKKHTGAVIFALENMRDGQVVEWYNNSEETFGKIKPIMSWNVQGGVCRKLVTLVQKGSKVREYEEVGCYTLDSQFWTFSRR